MNSPDPNVEDAGLSRALKAVRATPGMPPRFQENVWRRIEASENREGSFAWLESLIGQLLRPRIAATALTALVVAGTILGTYEGKHEVVQTAQARYLASVAPSSLH